MASAHNPNFFFGAVVVFHNPSTGNPKKTTVNLDKALGDGIFLWGAFIFCFRPFNFFFHKSGPFSTQLQAAGL